MDINFSQKFPKPKKIYACENCNIITNNKKDYNNHISTSKHIKNIQEYKISQEFICDCGKQYTYYSGLYKHKKKCTYTPPMNSDVSSLTNLFLEVVKNNTEIQKQEISDFKNLILEMMKSNTELQTQMWEVCKNSSNHTTHNTNNSHNKTFNMQFFLNEQCKDAMNIKDFVDSFQLQFADLERIGEIGYVDGISELIINKLNEMDIYKRPIHCSDTKRDIMYVRAENVWEKETNGHSRLRLFIKQITHKNIKLIPLWAETHPQAKDHQHPLNDNYLGMVSQAMGGRGNLEESENKIIKRIAKTVYIDKYHI
jgi:hypothetical protein